MPKPKQPPEDKVSRHRDAESAAPKQRQRGIPFKPGESGNPAGRPKGSRNRLGETFLSDLVEIWHLKGPDALRIVAATEPTAFCKLVASILPREVISLAMSVNTNITVDLNAKASSFMTLWNTWRTENGEPAPLELSAEAETSYRIDGDNDDE